MSRHSPSSVDSSDTRQRSIRAKWHKGTDALYHFARKRHAEAGTRTVAARIAPRPSPAPIAPEAEVGPCRRNRAVRFVVSGLRTNGQPKTGKSMRYNSRTGVRQPMPFRKHQVDCLHLWRLSSTWILKRILLAIFNLRGREEGPGLSQGCLAKGFRVKAGRGDGRGLHAGMPAARETGAPRASRQGKAICRTHPHSSESQNEEQTRIDQDERMGTIRPFEKTRGIYLRKDGCACPFSPS